MSRILAPLLLAFFLQTPVAHASPFGVGWTLEAEASALTFRSTKGEDITETSSFAALTGEISADGSARIEIVLDSLDTGIEIRDVRMRALLFETFRLPVATITAELDQTALTDARLRGTKEMTLPISVTLNENTKDLDTSLKVAVITDQIVSVSSVAPVMLSLADFGLLPGLQKLEEAAGTNILPRTEIEFDLLFRAFAQPERGLEDQVSMGACIKRIATIGASDQVYFTSGSAQLETKSFPLLDAVVDTIEQCPGLVVKIEGHTDNVGPDEMNLDLSDRRAAAVVTYLTGKGVSSDRLSAEGYGEARPIADNNTRRGRWQNRRIEFVGKGT